MTLCVALPTRMSALQGQEFAWVVTAVCCTRVVLSVHYQQLGQVCTWDPAPRDHTTQAVYKNHFKLEKARSISAHRREQRNRGPSPVHDVVASQPSGQWERLSGRHR